MPTGTVKWFSDDKGFGFITPDDGDKDLFVHHTGIVGEGYRSLQEGAKVSFDAETERQGAEGRQRRHALTRRSGRTPAISSRSPPHGGLRCARGLRVLARISSQPTGGTSFPALVHRRETPALHRHRSGGERAGSRRAAAARRRRPQRAPHTGAALARPQRQGPAALVARRRRGVDRAHRDGAASLLIVSLAAAHPGPLVPATQVTALLPVVAVGTDRRPHGLAERLRRTPQRVVFTAGIAVMLVAYVVVAFAAGRLRPAWVIAAIVALHVIFLLSPPLTLTDVFNYLNYGRMEYVYHLNPYTTIPALEPHSDPTFLLSNWHGLLSPYGPLFTVFTIEPRPARRGRRRSGRSRSVLMVASLATIFLVYRCAQLLGRNPVVAAVIVGANPIVLVWGMGGDHNDFLMLFFLVLAALAAAARALDARRPPRAPARPRRPRGAGRAADAPGPGSTACRGRSSTASRGPGWRSAPASRSSPPSRSRPPPRC